MGLVQCSNGDCKDPETGQPTKFGNARKACPKCGKAPRSKRVLQAVLPSSTVRQVRPRAAVPRANSSRAGASDGDLHQVHTRAAETEQVLGSQVQPAAVAEQVQDLGGSGSQQQQEDDIQNDGTFIGNEADEEQVEEGGQLFSEPAIAGVQLGQGRQHYQRPNRLAPAASLSSPEQQYHSLLRAGEARLCYAGEHGHRGGVKSYWVGGKKEIPIENTQYTRVLVEEVSIYHPVCTVGLFSTQLGVPVCRESLHMCTPFPSRPRTVREPTSTCVIVLRCSAVGTRWCTIMI